MREKKRLEMRCSPPKPNWRGVRATSTPISTWRTKARTFRPICEREVDGLRALVDKLETETLLSGENDERNAIVTIHPGAGGTESQDWAEMLMRMYHALGRAPGILDVSSTNISRATRRASSRRPSGSTASTLTGC